MLEANFPPWPYYAEDEISAVSEVLRSGCVNYWTGDIIKDFEREFSRYVGTEYAIALSNGTVAIDLALHALEIGKGDEVIVTSRTFIATASSIALAGAVPIFADVDAISQNITADTIAACITKKTKAIILVHLAGWPCDMDPIMALAKEKGLFVIEDCAQAHGASYKGQKVGSMGDIATFSFCQDKIISTGGEGGMLVTNNKDYFERAWSFKDHKKNNALCSEKGNGISFRWLHESLGSNYRITEMQAAIGRKQMEKLPAWTDSRNQNASQLNSYFLDNEKIRAYLPPENCRHAYYKYYAFIDYNVAPELVGKRDLIVSGIREKGVPCFTGSCSEVYREKAFDFLGLGDSFYLPVARQLGESSIMFLVHPTLETEHMHKTISAVEATLKEITKP